MPRRCKTNCTCVWPSVVNPMECLQKHTYVTRRSESNGMFAGRRVCMMQRRESNTMFEGTSFQKLFIKHNNPRVYCTVRQSERKSSCRWTALGVCVYSEVLSETPCDEYNVNWLNKYNVTCKMSIHSQPPCRGYTVNSLRKPRVFKATTL